MNRQADALWLGSDVILLWPHDGHVTLPESKLRKSEPGLGFTRPVIRWLLQINEDELIFGTNCGHFSVTSHIWTQCPYIDSEQFLGTAQELPSASHMSPLEH